MLLLGTLLAGGLPHAARAEGGAAEVAQLRLERAGEALALVASVRMDLPSAVEDALLKGLPIFFVAEAEVFRERWYWTDKKMASVARHMRLVFHPLTRRWRLAIAAGAMSGNGGSAALNLSFDSLEEALGAVQRITGWRIAELADLDPETAYRLDFRFRLDVSQLPRPLQIGVLGQADWNIATSVSQRFTPGTLK